MSRLLHCEPLDQETREFYRRAITLVLESGVPFLVGGGYAFEAHTGIKRHTKDFDIFVRRADVPGMLDVLERAGYETEITYPHWLGKAFCGKEFIDVIFNSGNGLCPVDDEWFEHAVDVRVLDLDLKACPLEETIWQKAFIQERERYDGADVAHLIRAGAERLDWNRLLRRFGDHWRVLLGHLVLFGYIYPGEQHRIPDWVLRDLTGRANARADAATHDGLLCRGTLLSSLQYSPDVEDWGYEDGRLEPTGRMTRDDLAAWRAGVDHERARKETPASSAARGLCGEFHQPPRCVANLAKDRHVPIAPAGPEFGSRHLVTQPG